MIQSLYLKSNSISSDLTTSSIHDQREKTKLELRKKKVRSKLINTSINTDYLYLPKDVPTLADLISQASIELLDISDILNADIFEITRLLAYYVENSLVGSKTLVCLALLRLREQLQFKTSSSLNEALSNKGFFKTLHSILNAFEHCCNLKHYVYSILLNITYSLDQSQSFELLITKEWLSRFLAEFKQAELESEIMIQRIVLSILTNCLLLENNFHFCPDKTQSLIIIGNSFMQDLYILIFVKQTSIQKNLVIDVIIFFVSFLETFESGSISSDLMIKLQETFIELFVYNYRDLVVPTLCGIALTLRLNQSSLRYSVLPSELFKVMLGLLDDSKNFVYCLEIILSIANFAVKDSDFRSSSIFKHDIEIILNSGLLRELIIRSTCPRELYYFIEVCLNVESEDKSLKEFVYTSLLEEDILHLMVQRINASTFLEEVNSAAIIFEYFVSFNSLDYLKNLIDLDFIYHLTMIVNNYFADDDILIICLHCITIYLEYDQIYNTKCFSQSLFKYSDLNLFEILWALVDQILTIEGNQESIEKELKINAGARNLQSSLITIKESNQIKSYV